MAATLCPAGCFAEDAEKVEIVGPPPGTAVGCAPGAGAAAGSGGGGSADNCPERSDPNEIVVARFKNNFTDRDVHVFWVNWSCVEEHELTVGPGQTQQVATFVTHVWIVRDAETQELLAEVEIEDTSPRTYEVP